MWKLRELPLQAQGVRSFQSQLETVDADELLKCLGRAGVAQVQVWFSLDPVKVFPSQEMLLPLRAPPLLARVPARRSGPPLALPWLGEVEDEYF